MKNRTFHYYQDPSHGWLKVPLSLLFQLGIETQISSCSYRRGDNTYLEEDCDASLLLETCKFNGIEVTIVHHHGNKQSKIRNYEPYK